MKKLSQFSQLIGIALTAFVGWLFCSGTSFASPFIVGNVCCVGSTIKTYDYATGKLIASFTPTNDFNGRGVEVIGNTVYYTGSGEREPGAPNLHDIYLAPFNGGLGGHDTGIIISPRPAYGIQDLDYSNGVLYALTGYYSGPPIVYPYDLISGKFGTSVAIQDHPNTGADGFTVLPNLVGYPYSGDFLINDADASGVYRGYSSSTGLPDGLVIHTFDCCGVDYNPVDQLLYYSGGSRTDLYGAIQPGSTFISAGFEGIDVLDALPVPEPSSLSLLLCASLIGRVMLRRGRNRLIRGVSLGGWWILPNGSHPAQPTLAA